MTDKPISTDSPEPSAPKSTVSKTPPPGVPALDAGLAAVTGGPVVPMPEQYIRRPGTSLPEPPVVPQFPGASAPVVSGTFSMSAGISNPERVTVASIRTKLAAAVSALHAVVINVPAALDSLTSSEDVLKGTLNFDPAEAREFADSCSSLLDSVRK